MDFGKLIQQLHHAVVIFQRVQTDPWQTVLAGNKVFVERLMLMPQNDNAQNRHAELASLACASR